MSGVRIPLRPLGYEMESPLIEAHGMVNRELVFGRFSVKKLVLMLSVALVAPIALSLQPESVEAQRSNRQALRDRNAEKLVVTPLNPVNMADSAFVIELAGELRERIGPRARNGFRALQENDYCRALRDSGFPCDVLLDFNQALALAQTLSGDAFITGTYRSANGPVAHVRMVDISRSGLAGWITVRGESGITAEDFARLIGDELRGQINIAEDVREGCLDRLDRNDPRGARERADEVLAEYPNHPSAAICAATALEAQNADQGEIISYYEQAVAGDSMLIRGWERLFIARFTAGDTASAFDAIAGQLRADPTNTQLRINTIDQLFIQEDWDLALELIEEGLAFHRFSDDLMRRKFRGCSEIQEWDCVLDAVNDRAEFSPDLLQDSTFLQSAIFAAQSAGDVDAEVEWTDRAVANFPNNIRFLSASAVAKGNAGDVAGALSVYDQVIQLDASNLNSRLAAAQLIISTVTVDSTVALDTATLREAERRLTEAATLANGDETVEGNIGGLFAQTGIAAAQSGLAANRLGQLPDEQIDVFGAVAFEWLTAARGFDLSEQSQRFTGLFLGWATITHLQDYFTVVRESESCEEVDNYENIINAGFAALDDGEAVAEQFVASLRPNIDRFAQVVPNFRQVFQCQATGQ